MLKDSKGRRLVFGNKIASSSNILQVVVRDFFALNLVEIGLKITKENAPVDEDFLRIEASLPHHKQYAKRCLLLHRNS